MDSFKAVFKAARIRLKDYSIGGRGTGCKVVFSTDEAGELTGARAMAWLENNLFSGLRLPYTGARRWELSKYGSYYRAGMVKPCPLTGYCADEDFLDSLKKSVKSGDDLKSAFEHLAAVAARLIESESENQAGEEYFLDHAEANGFKFSEDGELI